MHFTRDFHGLPASVAELMDLIKCVYVCSRAHALGMEEREKEKAIFLSRGE